MRIAVIGDVLLDIDIEGRSTRVVPDGPGPVIDVLGSVERVGGAGLVATLLVADGHEVTLVAALSDDPGAQRIRDGLVGLSTAFGRSGAPTPIKTRIRAGGATLARLDYDCLLAPPQASLGIEVLDALAELADADAVVVADYGRGLAAHPRVRQRIAAVVGRVPIVWDPHPRGPAPVEGVDVLVPNLVETRKIIAVSDAPADEAGLALRALWRPRAVAVTIGEGGVVLCGDEAEHVPAPAIFAPDTCGAGDRLASALAARLAAGDGLPQATASAVSTTADFLQRGGVSALPVSERRAA